MGGSNRLSHEYRQLRKEWLAAILPADRKCANCGVRVWSPIWGTWFGNYRQQATIEHVIPRVLGGKERDVANFALFCFECNSRDSEKHGIAAAALTNTKP